MSYDNGSWDEDEPILITDRIIPTPAWFGNEVVIEDGYGELQSYTIEEWHEILLLDKDDLAYFFGLSHYDLLYDLDASGLWDEEDWEEWRDAYASVHGV